MSHSFERIFIPLQDARNENICAQYFADAAAWVWHPEYVSAEKESVVDFLLDFEAAQPISTECCISADNRFEFFCDEARIGMGPDRGDADHWSFTAYRMELSAGRHSFRVRAWFFPERMPLAQMMIRPGFLFGVKDPALQPQFNTGSAAWSVRKIDGVSLAPGGWATGGGFVFDVTANAAVNSAVAPVTILAPRVNNIYGGKRPYWRLCPSNLPEQLYARFERVPKVRAVLNHSYQESDSAQNGNYWGAAGAMLIPASACAENEVAPWQKFFDSADGTMAVPANSGVSVLIDMQDYLCAYPKIRFAGGRGATIRILWQESLQTKPDDLTAKGNRSDVADKYFQNSTQFDEFRNLDGAEHTCMPFWWRAGRFVLICVETKQDALTLYRPDFIECRYPLEQESKITFDDPRLSRIQPMLLRVLQSCTHETFMDCPFYEQLMYVADTRLEAISTYSFMADARMQLRALRLFDWSRSVWDGLVAEHYPGRGSQLSCTFNMLWPLLVRDYTLYRRFDSDETFLHLRRSVRAMVIAMADYVSADGVLENMAGWSFVDWVNDEWCAGIPYPKTNKSRSALFTLHYLMLLRTAMQLEQDYLPEQGGGLTAYYQTCFDRSAAGLKKAFWDEEKALFADEETHEHYCVHAQCFALLSGAITGDDARRCFNAMLETDGLAQPTISFIFYLFETLQKFGEGHRILDYVPIWTDMADLGVVTTWENPEPTRSDCHAWGAHLYHHYFASIVGIRPASAGFRTVSVDPSFGPLKHAEGVLPHPDGVIRFDLTKGLGGVIHGTITLPDGVTGVYLPDSLRQPLHPGVNTL